MGEIVHAGASRRAGGGGDAGEDARVDAGGADGGGRGRRALGRDGTRDGSEDESGLGQHGERRRGTEGEEKGVAVSGGEEGGIL